MFRMFDGLIKQHCIHCQVSFRLHVLLLFVCAQTMHTLNLPQVRSAIVALFGILLVASGATDDACPKQYSFNVSVIFTLS